MASIKDRQESLKRFSEIFVLEYIDEESGRIYHLTFDPKLGCFIISCSETHGRLPKIMVSHSHFFSSDKKTFNSKNEIGNLILNIKKCWAKMPKEDKMGFNDSLPLNSLFIGSVYQ